MGNCLQHWGIFGMHWGIRRFQNPDGTLTPEGKIRYSRSDAEKDFHKSINQHSEATKRILEGNEKIPKMADQLGERYRKAFSSMKLSSQNKEYMWNLLHKDFGDGGVNDDVLYENAVEQNLMWETPKFIPESLRKERAKFDKQQEQYWKDVEEITKDLRDKYKDSEFKDVKAVVGSYKPIDLIINDLLGSELDIHLNAHLSRHFDDYWVYDTKEYAQMIQRFMKEFPMNEFNRRYG